MNTKAKSILFFSFLLTFVVIILLNNTSMLRYGDRAYCIGFHDVGIRRSDGFASWHRSGAETILILANMEQHRFLSQHQLQLQTLYPGIGAFERDVELPISSKIGSVNMLENEDIVAITRGHWIDRSGEILLMALDPSQSPRLLGTIADVSGDVALHPIKNELATTFYPEGSDQGSNIIALYNLSAAEPVQTDTFRLKRIAINRLFGWSHDGQVIAVSQYDKNGEIPYYVFVESGQVVKSLYHESTNNCVTDGHWSPNEPLLSFSGQNEETEGWDIFLETILSSNNDEWVLVNLTSTLHEDEYNAVWSPNGEYLAFIKVYKDVAGNRRQELFAINFIDDLHTPIQLTNNLGSLVDNPWWISNTEIAYLTWSPAEHIWSLNVISLEDYELRKILDLPQSLYKES